MRRLGGYEGLLPGLLAPYLERGKLGGNYEGLLLPNLPLFQMQGKKGALHDEAKKTWQSSMEQRDFPATLGKRRDGQFGLVGSLERNARKLGASGPPPSLRASCLVPPSRARQPSLRHLRVVGRGACARGPGGPK